MQIEHGPLYKEFIEFRGVGSNDRVASSPYSYLKYLEAVSGLLGENISPKLLHTLDGVERVKQRLDGKRSPKTINNYASAMKQYVAMVIAHRLWPDPQADCP